MENNKEDSVEKKTKKYNFNVNNGDKDGKIKKNTENENEFQNRNENDSKSGSENESVNDHQNKNTDNDKNDINSVSSENTNEKDMNDKSNYKGKTTGKRKRINMKNEEANNSSTSNISSPQDSSKDEPIHNTDNKENQDKENKRVQVQSNNRRKDAISVQEEKDKIIRFQVVKNDQKPDSMVLLTGLKNIFQKQLPKMPKEYIARLVYDRNHYSMAVVKDKMRVVGGITYRPFASRHFAEIVFCAIASPEQVKGYGARLMNHLKDHIRSTYDIQYFLTYADNYAIGYFKKQGFTTEITLEKPIWMGYIKDYEGGTLMQCTMIPKVDYLNLYDIIDIQREVINEKIKKLTKSHIVYPGLTCFAEGATSIEPEKIPGLLEAGWDPEMNTILYPEEQPEEENQVITVMRLLVSEMQSHAQSWPFLQPVTGVADYYNIITDPMDLKTLSDNVDDGQYNTLEEFKTDVQKIFDNCRTYNENHTPYYKCANKLEEFFNERYQYHISEMDIKNDI